MMSRKDYVAIAAAIKLNFDLAYQGYGKIAVINVAADIAAYLRKDNPNFDAKRFYIACGLESAKKG